jgi:hypothetical protein
MNIKITIDESQDLTIHDVSGLISEREMYAALEKFYQQEPTSHLLWDMSQTVVAHVTPDMLRGFVGRSTELGKHRQGGRTAIVATEDLQFGLARMSAAYAEFQSAPYSIRVFRSREEALRWLTSGEAS